MKRRILISLMIAAMSYMLSGCVMRTYSVYKEREDQDLRSGNQGFIQGKQPAGKPEAPRKTTRETKVVEIEVLPLIKSVSKKKAVNKNEQGAVEAQNLAPQEEAKAQAPVKSGEPVLAGTQEYKVQNGDTLQKISQKFYGTINKWNKIYDANKDRLKGPDKIRPGQTIVIPVQATLAPAPTPKAEEPNAPLKNLK